MKPWFDPWKSGAGLVPQQIASRHDGFHECLEALAGIPQWRVSGIKSPKDRELNGQEPWYSCKYIMHTHTYIYICVYVCIQVCVYKYKYKYKCMLWCCATFIYSYQTICVVPLMLCHFDPMCQTVSVWDQSCISDVVSKNGLNDINSCLADLNDPYPSLEGDLRVTGEKTEVGWNEVT